MLRTTGTGASVLATWRYLAQTHLRARYQLHSHDGLSGVLQTLLELAHLLLLHLLLSLTLLNAPKALSMSLARWQRAGRMRCTRKGRWTLQKT